MDPVSDCLGFALGAAYRRIDREFNRAYQALGFSHAHGQVLASVLMRGPLRVADIAFWTGFEQSTVSRLAAELSRRKLIRRKQHPHDGRARLLEPAKRGEALRAEILEIHRRINAQLRRSLTDQDLEGFRRALEPMNRLT